MLAQVRCESGPAPHSVSAAALLSKNSHRVRHLPWPRRLSFCSGWLAAAPDKKACKGALDICWGISRSPMGMWPGLALWECHMKLKWGAAKGKNSRKTVWREGRANGCFFSTM